MLTLIAGAILLFLSFYARVMVKDSFHPAFVFSTVWGVGLFIISFLPLAGFFEINSNVVFLFVAGGALFSITAIITQKTIGRYQTIPTIFSYEIIDCKKVAIFVGVLHVIVLPMAFYELLAVDNDVMRAAYLTRQYIVAKEQVFSVLTSNYMLIGQVIIPLLTIYLIKKKVKVVSYILIAFPWMAMSLLMSGRAGLIQMIFGLLFIYYIVVGRLPLRFILYIAILFLLVMVSGALTVNKVDLSLEKDFTDIVFSFLKHIAEYAFQGPILFSKYYDGKIIASPIWSPFSSICHMLSFVDACTPPPSLHADFNSFGYRMVGNVYSIYFSTYPNYGLSGTILVLSLYSAISTYLYNKAKTGNVFCLIISSYLFSATVLSLSCDAFLTNLWFFIKVIILLTVLILVCGRNKQFIMMTRKVVL
ncbi:MAG: O-antigen polymerase [Pseudomonadota bacterium]